MLWQAINPLEARDLLMQMRVADYPHNEQSTRRKVHEAAKDEAYPFSEPKAMSWEELGAMMHRRADG